MGIGFIISGLCVSILINLIYFTKKRVKNFETTLYGYLIIVNLLGLLLELSCTIVYFIDKSPTVLRDVLVKTYMVFLVGWAILFMYYVLIISCDTYKNFRVTLIKITTSLFLVACIVIGILPIEHIKDGNAIYASGLAVDMTYVFTGVILTVMLLVMVTHYKKLKNKKYLPLFSFIVLGAIVSMIQFTNPELLMVTALELYIMLMMYFTIENPDVKMINYLNLAKDTAEKANRAKSDFLSSMSHEIRTPLNAIVGFSECILNADNLEEAKENASDVVSASKTLLEIVNGILDISKIEAGKLELVETDYSTKKVFNDVVKLIQARIGDKSLEFKVSIAEDLPLVLYGDQMNVKKILINLLTNAVKYTEQGFISLDVKCVKNNDVCRLIISVKDTGRGIKQENIDKLFTKFQRVDEDRNTTIEGTGLGLAITKQLVEMMNGKIVVNSTYGEGSEFKVAIDQRLSLAKIEEEKEEDDFNLDLTGKKILVVDDNKLNLKVAQKLLVKYNPTVITAESGFECLNLINSGNTYDLILLDDMMPKMRGSETLIRLKQLPNFNIPVVVLTANAINGMKEQYIKDGFNDYLAKPIEKPELYRVLRKYLGNDMQEITIDNQNKHNKKVLLVDDNKLNITVATNFLKPYDFDIESCLSGIECLNLINQGKIYDLMFIDIMMPNMDGVELLHKLKQLPNFKTKCVALTADAVEGAKEKYLSSGFDAYLSKPIDKTLLNDIINNLLEENNSLTQSNKSDNIDYLKQNNIDIDKSLELLGDINTYNDLLKEFMATIKDKVNNLYRYKNNNDLANYAILVHSLKSDSRYLGFTKLADIALQHELKSKENDLTYLNNNFNLLFNEVKEVVNIISKYLN